MCLKTGLKNNEVVILGVIDRNLDTITIPATIGNYPVTEIDDSAFYENRSLIEIKIPESITRIGEWAFYKCSSLVDINIPNSITDIGRFAFSECSRLNIINGNVVENRTIELNVRFIYFKGMVYRILKQIGNDYHIKDSLGEYYLINNMLYNLNIDSINTGFPH